MQVGNNSYVSRQPAAIPLASHTDDPNAPSYVSSQAVSDTVVAPDAAADFRVQMGNVGQHYHDWRYSDTPPPPPPPPTTPVVPLPTAIPTSVPQPVRPNSDFVGTWLNDNENTKDVAKLWIDAPDAFSLKVHWFGACGDSLCDNESKIAPYNGEPFNITLNGRTFSLSFADAGASQLKVAFGDDTLLFHRTLARDYFGTWLKDDAATT